MNTKQVIVVIRLFPDGKGGTKKLQIGKIAAQVSHASMAFLLDGLIDRYAPISRPNSFSSGKLTKYLPEEQLAWLTDPESAHAKVVVSVDSEKELRDLIASAKEKGITVHEVIDAGRTEFHGIPQLTCAAFGPHEVSKFIGLTDHLKLL